MASHLQLRAPLCTIVLAALDLGEAAVTPRRQNHWNVENGRGKVPSPLENVRTYGLGPAGPFCKISAILIYNSQAISIYPHP